MKSIGIDIGSYSVKVAEMSLNGKNLVLNEFTEFPLSSNANTDRALEMIETLRSIALKYGPAISANTPIIMALPQNDVTLRLKRFPFRERPKILKSLSFELEDEIPLDLDEAITEAKIVEYLGDQADVLVSACAKETLKVFLTRGTDTGVEPNILSVEGLALANVFEAWDNQPTQSPAPPSPIEDENGNVETPPEPNRMGRAIIHIGHNNTLVLVYRETALVAVRALQFGGIDLVNSIAQGMSISPTEATKVLHKQSFILLNTSGVSPDQVRMSELITAGLAQLIRDLRITMIGITAELNITLTGIELSGGVGQIQNLAPYLTQYLEAPVNFAHYFDAQKITGSVATANLEASAGVAIGLCLEGFKRARNPATNFRKAEFAKQNETLKIYWEKYRSVIQVSAVSLGLLFTHAILRDSFATDLAERVDSALAVHAKNIAGLKGTAGVEKYVQSQNSQLKNRRELAKLDNYTQALEVVAKITDRLPVNQMSGGQKITFDLTHFDLQNDDLLIEGVTAQPLFVEAIEKALKTVAKGELKKTDPTKKTAAAGVPFAYRMKVTRVN